MRRGGTRRLSSLRAEMYGSRLRPISFRLGEHSMHARGRFVVGSVRFSSPTENVRNVRSAYTLVEMLIASILVATLMATVWNLTSLYSGFLMAGRAQAEEQQLARSLMDVVSTDLHALILSRAGAASLQTAGPRHVDDMPDVFDDQAPPISVGDAFPGDREVSEFESASAEIRTLFGIDGNQRILPTFDIRGRAHMLTLTITDIEPTVEVLPVNEETGEPMLDESITAEAGTLATEPDLLPGPPLAPEYRRIVYEFVPPRIMESASVNTEDDLLPGLYRYEIPIEHLSLLSLDHESSGFGSPPELNNVSEMIEYLSEQGVTSLNQEHVPEVVGCEFEYLTDSGWESSWTARDDGRTLRAIRVRLRLLSLEEHEEMMTALGASVLDEPDEQNPLTTEEPLAMAVDFGAEQDPFKQFSPRTFERIVLMGTPKRLSLGDADDLPFGQETGLFSSSTRGGEQ